MVVKERSRTLPFSESAPRIHPNGVVRPFVVGPSAEGEGNVMLEFIVENFETLSPRIRRFIRARIGDEAEVEELTSEVFLRVLKKSPSYKPTKAPKEAYVFKTANNLSIDHLRKKGVRPKMEDIEGLDFRDKDPENNPVEVSEREEEKHMAREVLKKLLGKLTVQQREVVEDYCINELSFGEISKKVGKKEGTLRELKSFAFKKMRESLSGEDLEDLGIIRKGS